MRLAGRMLRAISYGAALAAGAFLASAPITFARMIGRFSDALSRGSPSRPDVTPPESGRSMDDVLARLKEVPFNPVRPALYGMLKGVLGKSFIAILDMMSDTAGYIYPYPDEFEEVTLESFDGTKLAAVAGIHRDGRRPGLVLAHGYMGCKNDHYIYHLTLRAFAEWGYNVLAVDLRDFGASMRLGFSPTTLGWKEGEDLLTAARHLGERPEVTTVGLTGFSMGALSAMRAAALSDRHPYLTGGAIAWNGASDARRVVSHLDCRPGLLDSFTPYYAMFRLNHRLRRWDMRRLYRGNPGLSAVLDRPLRADGLRAYLEEVSAPRYGVSCDEILSGASSRESLPGLEVPLLVIHAADDPVVPVSEMDDLLEISEVNPNLRVWITPGGNHCVYPYLDPDWFFTVSKLFFDYWAAW